MSLQPFDTIVIGGGPAGMMAAGRAAERGASVLLIEKNETLGKKLLITGGGRCNMTNAVFDAKVLAAKYGPKGKALISPFLRFGAQDTLDFFHSRNLLTKTEAESRVFPVTNTAQDVCRVMVGYMHRGNVTIRTKAAVSGFIADNRSIVGVQLGGETLTARSVILATGGKSHPETGSTGDGFQWLKDIGHTVIEPDPALVPVAVQEKWTQDLMGVSLKNVKLTILLDGHRMEHRNGKLLFTHFGLSGPLVLNVSKRVGELHRQGDVSLSLDLLPHWDDGTADRKLLEIFDRHKNRMLKNSLHELVESKLAAIVIRLSKVNGDTHLYRLTKEERQTLIRTMKDLRLTVSHLLSEDKAVVTSGGVDIDEVDFKTMRSKLYDNLYLAGDILDFDRPSGGFSLQICWTTGWIAGESCLPSH